MVGDAVARSRLVSVVVLAAVNAPAHGRVLRSASSLTGRPGCLPRTARLVSGPACQDTETEVVLLPCPSARRVLSRPGRPGPAPRWVLLPHPRGWRHPLCSPAAGCCSPARRPSPQPAAGHARRPRVASPSLGTSPLPWGPAAARTTSPRPGGWEQQE